MRQPQSDITNSVAWKWPINTRAFFLPCLIHFKWNCVTAVTSSPFRSQMKGHQSWDSRALNKLFTYVPLVKRINYRVNHWMTLEKKPRYMDSGRGDWTCVKNWTDLSPGRNCPANDKQRHHNAEHLYGRSCAQILFIVWISFPFDALVYWVDMPRMSSTDQKNVHISQ